jgi:hypothetical protein
MSLLKSLLGVRENQSILGEFNKVFSPSSPPEDFPEEEKKENNYNSSSSDEDYSDMGRSGGNHSYETL